MNEEVVREALREGYAFTCAMCQKLWWAKAKGLDKRIGCQAAVLGQSCGGPMAGMSFPLYEGPLTESALATSCFRCGQPADEAVTSRLNPTRFIGVCKRHLPTLDRLVPEKLEATG